MVYFIEPLETKPITLHRVSAYLNNICPWCHFKRYPQLCNVISVMRCQIFFKIFKPWIICSTSTSLCVVMNATFKKHSKSEGMQEKESNKSVRITNCSRLKNRYGCTPWGTKALWYHFKGRDICFQNHFVCHLRKCPFGYQTYISNSTLYPHNAY